MMRPQAMSSAPIAVLKSAETDVPLWMPRIAASMSLPTDSCRILRVCSKTSGLSGTVLATTTCASRRRMYTFLAHTRASSETYQCTHNKIRIRARARLASFPQSRESLCFKTRDY